MRLPERRDLDITPFDWGDIYRADEVRKTKRLMNYGQADLEKDWELAVSLAFLSSRPDNRTDWQPMLDACFVRIYAYLANHPEGRPWQSRAVK